MQSCHATNFAWLLKLRWGAAAGQLVIALFVRFYLDIAIPLAAVLPIIGIELGTNAAAWLWARRHTQVPEAMLAVVMVLDVVLLTLLLSVTGGPFNPFNFLYLVHIALAAVVLRPQWAWGLTVMAISCCAALFYGHSTHQLHAGDMLQMHLRGMWVAFGVAAGFIVYFVQRVTRALSERDAELVAVRDRAARHDKLASLAALAAGAAHELSTPLSTIAVVAKELEHQLGGPASAGAAAADARIIREQVERCREILAQMAADAGQSTGEPLALITVSTLIDMTLASIRDGDRVALRLPPQAAEQRLRVPVRAVVRAIHAVIDNARQAAPASPIRLEVSSHGEGCRIAVIDDGTGMTDEQIARAGEPFFTTRGAGKGMGLGLFLTRTLLDRLGGRLELASTLGAGTTAAVCLPVAPAATIRRIATEATPDAA